MANPLNYAQGRFVEVPPKFLRNETIYYTDVDGNVDITDSLVYETNSIDNLLYIYLDSKKDYTDTDWIKIVGDNLIGPYTTVIGVKTLFYDSENDYYFIAQIVFERNFGDFYSINFMFDQIVPLNFQGWKMIVLYIITFLKTVLVIIYTYSIFHSARITNHEYNLWYQIGIKEELPEVL